MIADRIHRVAHTRFWRWPTIRLNQVNWYALMYAADATVTGSSALLRRDMRAQLVRFVTGPRNFGPGLRFQYLPHFGGERARERRLGRVREHRAVVPALLQPGAASGDGAAAARGARARAALDPPRDGGLLDARGLHELGQRPRLRALAPGQEARPRPAGADRDRADAAAPAWARVGEVGEVDARPRAALLRAAAGAGGGLPDPVLFQLFTVPQTVGSARLAAARLEANAARAVEAGLGRMSGERPPSLYAYDPDIGRLAITTPAYNTAIIAVNQRAFPYGGIELARLFDGEQEVAAGHRRACARGVRAAGARAERAARVLLPDRALARRPERHAVAADARAVGDGRERAHAAGQGVRGAVPRPARPRHVHRRALPRGHLAPLPAGVDRDAVAADAAAGAGAAERVGAAAQLGERRARGRGAARRLARERAVARGGARARGPLRGDQPAERLRRRAAPPTARCCRPGDGSVTTILSARSGSDARRRARARCELAASRPSPSGSWSPAANASETPQG